MVMDGSLWLVALFIRFPRVGYFMLRLRRLAIFLNGCWFGFPGAFFCAGVSVMLKGQTAHQSSAETGYLFRVERHALFLGHFDGDAIQILKDACTTNRPSANRKSLDDPGFLARADLFEFDAGFEFRDQVFDQFAEIHPG